MVCLTYFNLVYLNDSLAVVIHIRSQKNINVYSVACNVYLLTLGAVNPKAAFSVLIIRFNH